MSKLNLDNMDATDKEYRMAFERVVNLNMEAMKAEMKGLRQANADLMLSNQRQNNVIQTLRADLDQFRIQLTGIHMLMEEPNGILD